MASQVVTIDKVFTQDGNGKKGPWTRYDVKDAGGNKYQTFAHDLGKKAQALQGRPATITFHEEDRNGYTNNVIDGLEALNAETGHVEAPKANPRSELQRSKEEVRRTEAFKAAATIIASPGWSGEADLETLVSLGDAIADELASTGKVEPEAVRF